MNLFNLFAKISLDTSEYEKSLGESEKKTNSFSSRIAKGIGSGVKAIGTGIAQAAKSIGALAAAGSVAAAGLAKKATDAYANYEQLTGGVETLFKESSDTIMKYAQQAYKTAGLSSNEYMETITSFSASLLQSVGGDTKKAAEIADMAIRDMSDNANKMGTSMGSIQAAYQGFAKQNYTMLDNLKLGYGGTKSEMDRLIRDAEKMDSSFSVTHKKTKKGADEISYSYADIVRAINIVQTEMGVTGTTALEAEKTISGSAASMKASWENLLVSLSSGENMSESIMQVADSAKTYLSNIIPVFIQSVKSIGTAIKEIAPVIINEIPEIVKDAIPSLLGAGIEIVRALAQGLINSTDQLLDSAIEVIEMFISFLIDSSPEIVEAGIRLLIGLGEGIVKALPKLIPMVTNAVMGIAKAFVKNLPLFIKTAIQLMQALANGLIEALPIIIEMLPELINMIIDAFLDNIDMFIDASIEIIFAITNALVQNADKLLEAAPEIIAKLVIGLLEAIPKLLDAADKLIASLVDGIIKGAPALWEKLKRLGGELVDRIKEGWQNSSVKQWVEEKITAIKNGFNSAKEAIKTTVSNVFGSIKDSIQEKMEEAKEKVQEIVEKIKGFFDFTAKTPKIKLPHFAVEPEGWKLDDLLKGVIPKLTVKWYRKAYENPYMFTSPTVVGNRGFGDGQGGEMVYGHENLMNDIRAASADNEKLDAIIALLQDIVRNGLNANIGKNQLYKTMADMNRSRTYATGYNGFAGV